MVQKKHFLGCSVRAGLVANAGIAMAMFMVFLPLFQPVFGSPLKIVLVHTSDIHGRIAPQPDPGSNAPEKPLVGGFASLMTYMNEVRKEAVLSGGIALLIDGGDFFQGTPIVEETKGACMVDLMNRVRYFSGCIGNHEFDYGIDGLKENLRKCRFPILTANIFDSATGALFCKNRPYLFFEFKGKKIALIGVSTPETVKMSFAENVKGLSFLDPVPIVEKIIKKVRERGADLVVLVSHFGIQDDRILARKLPGVDIILGGHSHTIMTAMEQETPDSPIIVHPGADGKSLSRIDVILEDGKRPAFNFSPVTLSLKRFPEDPEIKKIVDKYQEMVDHEMKKIIGISKVELTRGVVGGDSPEGSFIADCMREAANADFAFINAGGVRCYIASGPITHEDIFFLQPFNNTIESIEMTGAQVIEMIEHSLSVPFSPVNRDDLNFARENFKLNAEGLKREFQGKYGYLIPSNLRIEFDPDLPPMKRIVKVADSSGKPIDLKRTYWVAFNNYMSMGGDGYSYLKTMKNRRPMTLLMRDSLLLKIKKDKGIHGMPEVRLLNPKLRVWKYDPGQEKNEGKSN